MGCGAMWGCLVIFDFAFFAWTCDPYGLPYTCLRRLWAERAEKDDRLLVPWNKEERLTKNIHSSVNNILARKVGKVVIEDNIDGFICFSSCPRDGKWPTRNRGRVWHAHRELIESGLSHRTRTAQSEEWPCQTCKHVQNECLIQRRKQWGKGRIEVKMFRLTLSPSRIPSAAHICLRRLADGLPLKPFNE
jgi:hypothetical protein